jgi:hypothetical protein
MVDCNLLHVALILQKLNRQKFYDQSRISMQYALLFSLARLQQRNFQNQASAKLPIYKKLFAAQVSVGLRLISYS